MSPRKTPRESSAFGTEAGKEALLMRSERNRLVFMGVLLLLLVVAFGASVLQKTRYENAERERLAKQVPQGQPEEVVAVRRFDPATIEGEVRDATPEQRVLIDQEPLRKMLDHVRGHGPGQWKALEPDRLTPALWDEILADPDSHRARPLWVRGRLASYEQRPLGEREAYYGTLESEGGTPVTFMTARMDQSLFGAVDEDLTYARLEGLFLEVYRRENEDGWVVTPLLVGSRLAKSWPEMDGMDDEMLGTVLAAVTDDTTKRSTGVNDAAFLAQYLLMDRFEQGWGETIDWDDPEVARELTSETYDWLMEPENGNTARGMPFVLPVSRNMDARTLDPGENPARIDTIMQGWISNQLWTSQGAVMKYVTPSVKPQIVGGGTDQLLTGRGIFLKKVAYDASNNERRIAPLFVMETLDVFIPPEDDSVETIFWFIGSITVLLVILIPWLVIRDRKQSERLRQELVRRKQERRRRAADPGRA